VRRSMRHGARYKDVTAGLAPALTAGHGGRRGLIGGPAQITRTRLRTSRISDPARRIAHFDDQDTLFWDSRLAHMRTRFHSDRVTGRPERCISQAICVPLDDAPTTRTPSSASCSGFRYCSQIISEAPECLGRQRPNAVLCARLAPRGRSICLASLARCSGTASLISCSALSCRPIAVCMPERHLHLSRNRRRLFLSTETLRTGILGQPNTPLFTSWVIAGV
jgi:hypothetical protein